MRHFTIDLNYKYLSALDDLGFSSFKGNPYIDLIIYVVQLTQVMYIFKYCIHFVNPTLTSENVFL